MLTTHLSCASAHVFISFPEGGGICGNTVPCILLSDCTHTKEHLLGVHLV